MQIRTIEAGAPAALIRKATRHDADRLMEMVDLLATHHGDTPSVTLQSLERDVFGPTACATALLAVRSGRAVGYALVNSLPHLHVGLRVMDLNHLFVEADHRGVGIGRQLVAAAVSEARDQDCGRLEVGTHPDNLFAQGLYRSLGFAPKEMGGPRYRLDLPAGGALPSGWV